MPLVLIVFINVCIVTLLDYILFYLCNANSLYFPRIFDIETAGTSDEGVNIAQIIAATIAGGRCSEQEVRIVIADLETESEIYSTIDANTFKVSV